jgi:hypothetical protein
VVINPARRGRWFCGEAAWCGPGTVWR